MIIVKYEVVYQVNSNTMEVLSSSPSNVRNWAHDREQLFCGSTQSMDMIS